MRKKAGKQGGGTLLGVVIGLVMGLAIALVVALMITKSPVPFNNKAKSDRSSISNVTPNADPNQPMYRGKDADPSRTAKAETRPEAADKAEVKGESQASKLDDKSTYYLQVGAFKNSSEAEGMRAKLALLGFEAGISEMITQNGTIYRVRIGPFTQAETMDRMRAKLAANGIEAAATRIQK